MDIGVNNMYVWILSGANRCGDEYPVMAVWDYEPTSDEIDTVLVDYEGLNEYDPEMDDPGCHKVIVGGVSYVHYIDADLTKIKVTQAERDKKGVNDDQTDSKRSRGVG